MLAFANSRPSSSSPFHSCLNPHSSYETELKIAEIITLGIYYARLVSKTPAYFTFCGFCFCFSCPNDSRRCISSYDMYNRSYYGRDLLTNDERQKKGNNDKEVQAHITCNMLGKGFENWHSRFQFGLEHRLNISSERVAGRSLAGLPFRGEQTTCTFFFSCDPWIYMGRLAKGWFTRRSILQ